MAEVPRSSFIPKQTPGAVPSRVKRRKNFRAFSFSSTVILLASLVLGAGTFFYKDYLRAELENEKLALAAERDRFNEADIARVKELDYQLSAARLLIENHLSPSKIFDALELTTKERIQFTGFSFEQRPSNIASINISGGTEAFKTVAVQALQFGKDALFKDAVFTDVGTPLPSTDAEESPSVPAADAPEEHKVSFTIAGDVSASLLVFDGSEVSPLPETSPLPPDEEATSTSETTEDVTNNQ